MALILTETAKQLASQTNIIVNLILEIEGFPNHIFGTLPIDEEFSFDTSGYNFDSGYFFDQSIEHPSSKPYVTLDGSTKTVTSQLMPDKGVEAVRSFVIELLDKDDELSDIFTPGRTVDDLLGQPAKVYLNIKGSQHPVDSILLMDGLIGQYVFTGKGTCRLTVDHASQLKRQEIFMPTATELNGALSSGATTIPVDDASDFVLPTSEFLTYVRIGDEIIRYTGVSSNNLTGCTREQLDTVQPSTHSDESEVNSFYRLIGNPVELALKIFLSGGGYGLSKSAENFNQLTTDLFVENAIVFESKDIEDEFGLVIGDHVKITDSTSNNIETTIKSFGKIDSTKSYIVVDATLTTDTDDSATIQFKSKYDTLPQGSGLLPSQLDVGSHLHFLDTFAGNFTNMDFYLQEEIKVDDFVNQQLYRPTNLYSVPTNRASVKMTIPPLSDIYTKTLDSSNVISPNSINVARSVNRYSYNTIVYKFDPDRLDLGRYLTGKVILDNDAITRMKSGKKVFKVEADGLRRSSIVSQTININARRFLDRYRFAAETLSIVTFMSNIDIQVGDTLILQGLNIYDSDKATRDFGPKVYEVINTSFSIGNASIKLDLLSTNFGTDGKFGVVSPSSKIGSGATTTKIPLKDSFGSSAGEHEKWDQHIGATIRIHSNDWSYDETTTITGFDPDEENTAIVNTLSGAPLEDYIFDTCNYDDSSDDAITLLRDLYLFIDPSLTVTGATNASVFTVSVSDAAKLFVGSFIEVHNSDYSNLSSGKVKEISGTTITLESDLSFTPTTNDKIQQVGFNTNNGKPYRII